jgi:hypothetical protein
MTEHPITPPSELVEQWADEFYSAPIAQGDALLDLATRAVQWGADQELEACCEWVKSKQTYWAHDELRTARRPKAPSLKEQALDELHISFDRGYLKEGAADTIRRALEQLDD